MSKRPKLTVELLVKELHKAGWLHIDEVAVLTGKPSQWAERPGNPYINMKEFLFECEKFLKKESSD